MDKDLVKAAYVGALRVQMEKRAQAVNNLDRSMGQIREGVGGLWGGFVGNLRSTAADKRLQRAASKVQKQQAKLNWARQHPGWAAVLNPWDSLLSGGAVWNKEQELDRARQDFEGALFRQNQALRNSGDLPTAQQLQAQQQQQAQPAAQQPTQAAQPAQPAQAAQPAQPQQPAQPAQPVQQPNWATAQGQANWKQRFANADARGRQQMLDKLDQRASSMQGAERSQFQDVASQMRQYASSMSPAVSPGHHEVAPGIYALDVETANRIMRQGGGTQVRQPGQYMTPSQRRRAAEAGGMGGSTNTAYWNGNNYRFAGGQTIRRPPIPYNPRYH